MAALDRSDRKQTIYVQTNSRGGDGVTISADYVRQAVADMKPPALLVYGGDWLRDAVSGCSLPAQGLWLRLIFIMHDAKPYGHLVGPLGEPLTDVQLIRQIGCSKSELVKLREELIRAGVPRRSGDKAYDDLFMGDINGESVDMSPLRVDADGVVYSKRMVKDQRLRVLRRLAPAFGQSKKILLTGSNGASNADAHTYAGGLEKEKPSALSPEPEDGKPSSREISPQQAAVKSVIDALQEGTDRFAVPNPGRIAAWGKVFGAPFVVAVIRDLGAALDGKGASYLQRILENRQATGWQPPMFTSRSDVSPALERDPVEVPLAERVALSSRAVYSFIEDHGDPDENDVARKKFESSRVIQATDENGQRWPEWKRLCEETGVPAKPKRMAS